MKKQTKDFIKTFYQNHLDSSFCYACKLLLHKKKMKKYFLIGVSCLFLMGALIITLKSNQDYKDKWSKAEANVKAYDKLLSSSKEKSIALQLTAQQLSSSKDSILKELNETKKELKIKDKNIKSVQYISTTLKKIDTVIFRDTLFQKEIAIDTLIGDNWYKAEVHLHYPSTLILSPSFKSEKNIVVSTKKETINPPKKFWLFRLFQKKHKVLKVDVIEKNPYAVDNESRYVEIIK